MEPPTNAALAVLDLPSPTRPHVPHKRQNRAMTSYDPHRKRKHQYAPIKSPLLPEPSRARLPPYLNSASRPPLRRLSPRPSSATPGTAAPTLTFGTSRKQHQANIERLTAAASASRLLQVDTKAAGRTAKELGKVYMDRGPGEIDIREWPHRAGGTHALGEGSGAEMRGMSLGQERVNSHTGSEGSASMSGVPSLERREDYGRVGSHHGEGSRSSMAQLDNRVVGGTPEAALHDERSESAMAIPARKTPDSFDRRRHPPSVPSTSSSRKATAAVWIDLTNDSDDDDDDSSRASRQSPAAGGLGSVFTSNGAPQTSALAYLDAGIPGGGQPTFIRRLPYERPLTHPPPATPVRQGRNTPLSSGRSEASPMSSAGTAEDPIDFASLSDTDTEVDDPAAGADIDAEGHAAIGFDSMDADSLFAIGLLTHQVSHLDVGVADPIPVNAHDTVQGHVAKEIAPTLSEPIPAAPTPAAAAPIPAEPRPLAPSPAATIMVPLTQLFVPRAPDPAAPSQSEPLPIVQARDLSQRISAVTSKCKIVPIPSKGLGVVLTVDIAAGETILSEAPFLVARVNDLEHRHGRVVSAYTDLEPATRQLFDSFHPKGAHTGDRADIARLIDIWDTNAIPLGGADRQAEVTGLFQTISRLNHSCAPDTVWRWDEEEQAMHVTAYRDMPAGTELTASYIDRVTRHCRKRQAALLRDFGFHCLCTACSPPASRIAASDKRLTRYADLRSQWHRSHRSPAYTEWANDLPGALRDLETAERILREEQRYDALGEVLEARFTLYVQHGDRGGAVRVAKRWVEHIAVVRGAKEAEEWRRDLARPELLKEWEVLVDVSEAFEGFAMACRYEQDGS